MWLKGHDSYSVEVLCIQIEGHPVGNSRFSNELGQRIYLFKIYA